MAKGLAWKTATIADEGTISGAVDLGKAYRSLSVLVPALDSATLAIHTAMTYDGTYQALNVVSSSDQDDDPILLSTSTGALNVTVPSFGWQFLKFVAGAAQNGGPRVIYCAGFD